MATQATRRREVLPLVIVLSLASLFLFSYFNRFAGLRSGDGEYAGGVAYLAGRLPYRDYYTAGPPLNQWKSALELATFGKLVIVTRAAACVERLLIAITLYFWLRRLFSLRAAATASLVTIILSAGDHTDPLASYNHDAIFLAMLCGLATCLSLERRRTPRWLFAAACAGCAAGLSALTKQTVGLGAAASMLVLGAVASASLYKLRSAVLWTAVYAGAFLAPVIAAGLYLRHLGVLQACLHMLFVSGPQAKAPKWNAFLARELNVAKDSLSWLVPALIALILSARAVWKGSNSPQITECPSNRTWWALGLGGLLLLSISAALMFTSVPVVHDVSKCACYYSLLGCGLLGGVALVRALQKDGNSVRLWQVTLFASLSWAVAATLSLSWPVFEAMALPGLGLLLAAAIDGLRPVGFAFAYLVMATSVFLTIREKLDLPFSFAQEAEPPVRLATQASALPALRGMRLPPQTIKLLDETVRVMQAAGASHETVFTYPEMSVVYPLSDAISPTFSGSHNIDVVPDSMAREEAARLLRNRPAVILYARPTEADLRVEERVWREGRPSGQRSLVAALDSLVAGYRLIDTFQLLPEDNPVRLYVRPPLGASFAIRTGPVESLPADVASMQP